MNFKKIIAGAVSMLFVSTFAVSGNLSVSAIDVQNVEETDSSVVTDTKGQFIDALLTSEDTWTESPQGYTTNMHNSDVYCWFEDLNMNGTPELVIGPMVSGLHSANDFEVWTYDNGILEKFNIYYPNGKYSDAPEYSNSLSLFLHDVDGATLEGKASFRYQLFQDKTTGEYKYVCIDADGNGFEAYRGLEVISCNDTSINSGFNLTITDAGSYSCEVNGSSVSKEEFVNEYDKFFSNLTPYEISTKDFLYKSYIEMGTEDKKAVLTESYDAWAYVETSQTTLPLSEEVLKLKQTYENGNKCGDNATWSFDEATGTLTVSGTGAMYDYNNLYGGTGGTDPFAPWIDFIDSIKRIVIEDDITYISGGFLGCKNATELIIPESVTSVDVMAFRGCLSLKNVTIPKSLTSIGQDAFGLIGEEGIIEGFTISGYAGSAAEQYAKDHNIPFTYLTENGDSNNETDSTDSNNDNSDDKSDGKTLIPSSPETGDNLLAGAGIAGVIAGAGLYISAKKKNKK